MPEINENNKKVKSKPTGCCCCFSKSRSKEMFDETIHSVDQTVSDFASSTSLQSETVPYSSPVSNLKPGNVIRIQGLAHQRCSRFSVDFLSGLTNKTDIAFHLNPRLNQKYIVRNSRLNGRWGVEETTSIHKFSFERNKIFKLDIFCTEREFLISLNGKYICAFVYRVPLSSITTIEIRGLVEVYGVDFDEAQSYPETAPENVRIIASVGAEQTIIDQQQEMEIPATRLLPDGFRLGWQLEIYGRVKLLPHSFYINLQEGYQMWPHPIVHLHLNPRFSTTTGDRLFVRNAWINGEWGREERVPLFQFTPGSPFLMTIYRMDDHFAVLVDGKLTGEFKFRGNADKIDSVYIQGDITLMSIGLRRPTATNRTFTVNGDGCICDNADTEECTCTDSNTQVTSTDDCTCGDDATHTNTSALINTNANTNTNAGDDSINRTANTTIYTDANDRSRRSDSTNTTVYTDADDHFRRQSDTSASVYTDAGDYTVRHSDINVTVFTDARDHTVIHGDTSINTTITSTTNTNTTNTTNTTTSNITNNTNNPNTTDTTTTNTTTHTSDTTNANTDVTDATDATDTNTTAYSDAND